MSNILRRLVLLGAAFLLLGAPACAKKPKAGEEAQKESAGAEGGAKGSKGSASEEDIPAGNRGTLDDQGRVREASTKGGTEMATRGVATAGAEVMVEAIRFEFDSSELSADARGTLDEVKKLLDQNKTWKLTIEGHCDERGTEEYNLGLGQRRANAARQYLLSQGLTKSRLDTVSFGKTRPVDRGHDESAWARNRRGEFAFRK